MPQTRPDRFGDPDKRTCRHYSSCPELKEESEDEAGAQLFCAVCNASLWASADEGNS